MILYSLKCGTGHEFESWFQSAEAYDRLVSAGHVTCTICGTGRVEKAVMAPKVRASATDDDGGSERREDAGKGPLSTPASPAEHALRKLKTLVETNAEDVGHRFSEEARAIHLGDAPQRSIYGQARREEARALVEDGIPVLPLPWGTERTN